jgi:hypothetical protein
MAGLTETVDSNTTGGGGGSFSAQGAANLGSGVSGVVQDIGAYVGAQYTIRGEEMAAAGFDEAANIAFLNEEQASAAGKLQQVQTARQVFKTAGAGIASAAGNGLRMSGSAENILRNTHEQGAIANQLIGTQTQIEVNGFIQQMKADQMEAQQAREAAAAAKSSQIGDLIGAGVNAITSGVAAAGMAGAFA